MGLAFAVLSAHVAPAAAASPGPTVTDPAGLGASEPGDEQAEAPLEAVPEASGPPAVTPGAALRSRRPAAASGNTGISVPADAIASSLRVAAVKVRLKVHRGGTRLPDGERVSLRGAVVDGDADYTLTRAARPGERIVLLNYAAALPREPSELDEVAVATYLDGPFKPATFELFDQDGAVRITRVGVAYSASARSSTDRPAKRSALQGISSTNGPGGDRGAKRPARSTREFYHSAPLRRRADVTT